MRPSPAPPPPPVHQAAGPLTHISCSLQMCLSPPSGTRTRLCAWWDSPHHTRPFLSHRVVSVRPWPTPRVRDRPPCGEDPGSRSWSPAAPASVSCPDLIPVHILPMAANRASRFLQPHAAPAHMRRAPTALGGSPNPSGAGAGGELRGPAAASLPRLRWPFLGPSASVRERQAPERGPGGSLGLCVQRGRTPTSSFPQARGKGGAQPPGPSQSQAGQEPDAACPPRPTAPPALHKIRSAPRAGKEHPSLQGTLLAAGLRGPEEFGRQKHRHQHNVLSPRKSSRGIPGFPGSAASWTAVGVESRIIFSRPRFRMSNFVNSLSDPSTDSLSRPLFEAGGHQGGRRPEWT